MNASRQHPVLRPRRLNSYKAYAIGCALVWVIVWVTFPATHRDDATDKLLLFFVGWLVGWGGATIARVVYPPPKRHRSAGPRSFFQGFGER